MEYKDIFLDRLPKIDLHGFDRESARVATSDFVEEAVLMGWDKVVIIHGIGDGVVKGVVHEVLMRHKKVLDYAIYEMNLGCTVVQIDCKR